MRRREFIALLGGTAVAWPLAALAQQPERVRHIGLLRASPPPQRELDAFWQSLAEQGFIEGRNVDLIHHGAEQAPERLPELAAGLVNSNVDVIVADGGLAAHAAQVGTTTIPIVIARIANLLERGLVQNLARPGGNITGLSTQGVEITSKLFEFLKETVPGLARVASIAPRLTQDVFRAAQDEAARVLGLTLVYIDLNGADAADAAMRQAISAGAQAAVFRGTPHFSTAQRKLIVDHAAQHRLPIMYEARDFVEFGGFAAYGAHSIEIYRRTAGYVAKILQGTKPGDLPIEQAARFELVINMSTARRLGLDIPAAVLARADEVIE